MQRRGAAGLAVVLGAMVVALLIAPGNMLALMQGGSLTRVSVSSSGVQGTGDSIEARLSADGNLVVFASLSSNLVSGDTNGSKDIFVHNRQTSVTSRVSVASDGTQRSDVSALPAISSDGRFVAFESSATFVLTDTNGVDDVYVHDLQTGVTEIVSLSSTGQQGTDHSFAPTISGDGRFVTFASWASNLVPNDTNSSTDADIFVRDRLLGLTTRVSVSSTGDEADGPSGQPFISETGRFVTFHSRATTLVNPPEGDIVFDIYVHDRDTATTERLTLPITGPEPDGTSLNATLSADGRFVAFHSSAQNLVPGDTNGVSDVFVHDRDTDATTRISLPTSGGEGNGRSERAYISADGRFVVFDSRASNLVPDDTNEVADIFRYDRQTGEMLRLSGTVTGVPANNHSEIPAVSADGVVTVFRSDASNLVLGDTNARRDVFARDMDGPKPTPTPTATPTLTLTPSLTPTASNTPTPSNTPTATATGSASTPTATATGPASSPTATATVSSPTATATGPASSPTATATGTVPAMQPRLWLPLIVQ